VAPGRHRAIRPSLLFRPHRSRITTLALSITNFPRAAKRFHDFRSFRQKADRERVLLVSPERVHIFTLVKKRISRADGHVPLIVGYDGAKCVYRAPLPHLFGLLTPTENRATSGN
jgi:hypothetical protein